MTSLTEAEHRVQEVLSRIERALRGAAPRAAPVSDAMPTAGAAADGLALECARLRLENEALRDELAASQAQLVAVVDEVEGRLEGAIDQLDELAER
ncbi:MAG: hypothetical protein U1E17_09635 [Geminicoccaceae bacterium]